MAEVATRSASRECLKLQHNESRTEGTAKKFVDANFVTRDLFAAVCSISKWNVRSPNVSIVVALVSGLVEKHCGAFHLNYVLQSEYCLFLHPHLQKLFRPVFSQAMSRRIL